MDIFQNLLNVKHAREKVINDVSRFYKFSLKKKNFQNWLNGWSWRTVFMISTVENIQRCTEILKGQMTIADASYYLTQKKQIFAKWFSGWS